MRPLTRWDAIAGNLTIIVTGAGGFNGARAGIVNMCQRLPVPRVPAGRRSQP